MKRFLSTILALTMILSLVAAMGISVSAKEGDVLYEVNFKGDDKYAPAEFGVLKGDGTLATSVSDDGKSATVTYVGTEAGRAFWGGAIKGFTYGEGKQYTVSMKMAIATYDNNGKLASGNAGLLINMPKNTDADYLLNRGYQSLVGYYGCPNIRHTICYGAGSKAVGSLYYGDAYVTDAKYLSTVDADGFVDIAFVVDGANVKVFINNVYLDEYNAFNTGLVDVAGNLGLSVYLYNPNAAITLKDAVVYEGNTVKNPTYPDYYAQGPSVTNYDTAKTGDLLFTADFSRKDTGFSARALSGNAGNYVVTTDGGYIKFENNTKNGAFYYGGIVEGLEINPETQYTYDWKVKTGAKNSGLCFAVPTIHSFSNSINIYGQFSAGMKFATQHGSVKITNDIASKVGTDGFVVVDDIANDTDGYASFRVEMDGYTATVYYLNTEGQWVKYNVVDMTNTTKYDGSATYPHDTGFQLCVGFYHYYNGTVAEYKDINIYKGLLISDSEENETSDNLFDASAAACGTPSTSQRDAEPTYNANYYCSAPIYVKEGDVITFGPVFKDQGYYITAYNADGSVHTKQVKYANCTEVEVIADNAVILKWTVPEGVDSFRMATSQMFVDNTLITKNLEFSKADYLAYMQSKNIYVGYFTGENADTLTNLFPTSDTTFVGRASTSGDIASDLYRTSDYIPVVEGDIIYFGAAATSQAYQLVLYDANKKATTQMNYRYMVNIGAIDDDYAVYCYRMRPGTAYVRIVVSADVYDDGAQFATINQPFTVDTYRKMINISTISASNSAGREGDSVVISVSIADNTGFGCVELSAAFDTKVLEFVGAECKLANGSFEASPIAVANEKGMIELSYVGDENVTADGVLFELTFIIKEGAAEGDSAVTLALGDSSFVYSGAERIDFTAKVTGGKVTVFSGLLGDVNLDGVIDAYDLTALARHCAMIELFTDSRALANADIDKSGSVTADDITKLARHVARIEIIVQ